MPPSRTGPTRNPHPFDLAELDRRLAHHAGRPRLPGPAAGAASADTPDPNRRCRGPGFASLLAAPAFDDVSDAALDEVAVLAEGFETSIIR
jgi:hypothetical protein